MSSLRPLRRSGRGDATVGGGGDATIGGSGESAVVSPVRWRRKRGASSTLKLFLRTRGVATGRLCTGAFPCDATRGSREVGGLAAFASGFGADIVRGIGAFAWLDPGARGVPGREDGFGRGALTVPPCRCAALRAVDGRC